MAYRKLPYSKGRGDTITATGFNIRLSTTYIYVAGSEHEDRYYVYIYVVGSERVSFFFCDL